MTAARIQDLVRRHEPHRGEGPAAGDNPNPRAEPANPCRSRPISANFWKESYPKIKQELSRKYPKHEWR